MGSWEVILRQVSLQLWTSRLIGQLYCTDYCPVPLQEMGPTLFDTKFEKIQDLHVHASESATDEEDIVKLCEETNQRPLSAHLLPHKTVV